MAKKTTPPLDGITRTPRGAPRKPDAVRRFPQFMLRCPPDLLQSIHADATRRGVSANDWMIAAAQTFLAKGKT